MAFVRPFRHLCNSVFRPSELSFSCHLLEKNMYIAGSCSVVQGFAALMNMKLAPCLSLLALVQCVGLMVPGAPPLRGVHKQKRRFAEPTGPRKDEFDVSPLGTGLLLRWAEGQLSATDVQELALLAVQSGQHLHPEVVWLSSIGGATSTNNCSRALYRKYMQNNHLPKQFIIKLPPGTQRQN
jgi:hypothetical protein